MNFLFTLQLMLLASAQAGANFPVEKSASHALRKLEGSFESSGHRFSVKKIGQHYHLNTDAELTRYPECRTKIGRSTGQQSSGDSFAEIYFQLDRKNCPVDGHVTLHYNRAITGVDVYLIDVVIRRNSTAFGSRNRFDGKTMRWSLRKI